ncbi:capsule biosynthesis protein [Enterovirga sp.]|uniref:capsule biosynthesis protein n=1 Tax=Enterovirga sp. TaxID=2026350 RepID=UPI0026262A7B|nr:capsule biosynthesis protein [Enterovirga sp.]
MERGASAARSAAARLRAGNLFRNRQQAVDAKVTYLPSEDVPQRELPIRRITFLAFVVLPALLSLLYFTLLATDQYTAEMRFVIRQGGQDGIRSLLSGSTGGGGAANVGAMMSSLGGGSSASTATEDGHIVTSYIHSRAMIDDISKTVGLRELFARPEIDFYARLRDNTSADDLLAYWNTMVGTGIDATSGIITVTVRAFRPEDAVLVAKAIQDLCEKLINEISGRARQDALRRATEEVARAQAMMTAAIGEMERYRNEEGMIDPVQTATETGKLLTKVLTDQLAAEGQLFVASRSLEADSPTVRNLRSRVDTLRAQTAALRSQLAGNSAENRNVAGALVKFEEIMVKQKVAESLYSMAESGLDRARRTAEARSTYLTPFVPPSLPEDPSYPKRLLFPLAIGVICLVLWSIVTLICASVQDHRLR